MTRETTTAIAADIADRIVADVDTLSIRNTPNIRAVRRQYSREIRGRRPDCVLYIATRLIETRKLRWVAYELVRFHKATFETLTEEAIERLGCGIDSWQSVDAFGCTLSGPAWIVGNLPDGAVHRWAASEDVWWRRVALVSTVALNTRARGGTGDTARTLAVCRLLADDREDMVQKAMSWALRQLVVHDRDAVSNFLKRHHEVLAARVKREVRNKLNTGLKNPRANRSGQAERSPDERRAEIRANGRPVS